MQHPWYDQIHGRDRVFKLMKGKNGTTSFLPNKKKGGQVRFSKKVAFIPNRKEMCLAKDQAKQIYREIEKNEPINIQIVNQGIKDESKVRTNQE